MLDHGADRGEFVEVSTIGCRTLKTKTSSENMLLSYRKLLSYEELPSHNDDMNEPAILGENTVRFFSRYHSFRMTLRNSLAVILSEAKNLKPF
jgi:hypothetical protein